MMGPKDSLAAQMDANLADFWGAYALTTGGRTEGLGESLFVQTAIPHPLFNSVNLFGDDPAAVERALELGSDSARGQGVPVLWRVGARADGPALEARLQRAGLVHGEPDPAMCAALDALPPPDLPAGLTIEAATGPEARGDWGRLAAESFGLGDAVGRALAAAEIGFPAALTRDHLRFVARQDGEPVAVTALVLTRGLAGIYAVATRHEARGRGIGRALTLHAMAEGRRRGARAAILQASAMGFGLYRKLGFETVFDYRILLQG